MRAVAVRRIGALLLGLGLLSLLAVTPVVAAGISVNSLGNTAANDGFCTLREAISAAITNTASGGALGECTAGSGADVITFSVSGTIDVSTGLGALPIISSDLSIVGAGAITVDAANASNVFIVNGGIVTLSGLTITGGRSVLGAGIFIAGGTVTVNNSTISGNAATIDGGGIYNAAGALTVTDSTISGNSAPVGGGIFIEDGTVTVATSTISGNSVPLDGGGIFIRAGTMTVANSTISGNTAGSSGGGMYVYVAGTMTVANSTISGNSAGSGGGGIAAAGTETLLNTIVAGNTAPIGPDVDFNAETVTTSILGVPGGKTLADILVPAGLADNGGPTKTIALALVAGNPAIDTGTSATCAAPPVSGLDQRGRARPAACDIGAYEAQPPTVAAHAPVSVAATSAAGAVVTYTPPAGTNEQGVAASVACLPASGATFAVGSTTVTCTATDAVGHTGTGTFGVLVGAFAAPATPTPTPTPSATISDTAASYRPSDTAGLAFLLGVIGLLSLLGLWQTVAVRRRR